MLCILFIIINQGNKCWLLHLKKNTESLNPIIARAQKPYSAGEPPM